MAAHYWIETLGCPKNQVDSEKLAQYWHAQGYAAALSPGDADVVVVNTCAFIDAAREESIETILELADARREGARLVVTGCLAARAGAELARELPEVDLVADVGVPIELSPGPRFRSKEAFPPLDLLNLARPPAQAPWAYVKVAEGCDRKCGFCAIPSFRGAQRSRPAEAILREVEALDVREVVLVAQDLASYGNDDDRRGALAELVANIARQVARVRLLYLYPSSLTDALIETIVGTDVAYFDLSLQHVSARLLRRMRRYGSATRFSRSIARIREVAPHAVLRSSFIIGYPGEREEDHDALLAFLEEEELDWVGLFAFSPEEGTLAFGQDEQVPRALALERLRECAELQDKITARKRAALIGSETSVLIDAPGIGRSFREAPEIDGVVRLDPSLPVGSFCDVRITGAEGPDLFAVAAERPVHAAQQPLV